MRFKPPVFKVGATIDPACPACGCTMWISLIEPYKPRYDRRTFECPRCNNIDVIVVRFRDLKRNKEAESSDINSDERVI
jgi:hypothetical protein